MPDSECMPGTECMPDSECMPGDRVYVRLIAYARDRVYT